MKAAVRVIENGVPYIGTHCLHIGLHLSHVNLGLVLKFGLILQHYTTVFLHKSLDIMNINYRTTLCSVL